MTEASAHNRILVLHSSCTGDDKEEASPSEGTFVTADNDTADHLSELLEETIVCNLLFVPEHPSSVVSNNDYLHLPNNPMNPCGMSNVLTLEMLPKHWTAGPILLGLSSCHIRYHDNGGGDELSTALFVEPIPSTFVLDFSSENDFRDNTHIVSGQNRNENVIAVNKLSEIHVAFDIREALTQTIGLVARHENATPIHSVEDEGGPRSEDDSKKQCEDHPPENTALHEEATTQSDLRFASQTASNSPTFDESIARQNLDDREMVLRNLKARLDQGSETIDLILWTSGFFSLLSLVVLLWAIYQFYRSTSKSDRLAQDIRHCMEKSQDMLQTAVEEMTANNGFHREDRKNHDDKHRDHVPTLVEQPDNEELATPKREVIEICSTDFICKIKAEGDPLDKIENNQTPVRLFSATTPLIQQEPKHELCFIRPFSNQRGYDKMEAQKGNTPNCEFSSTTATKGWADENLLCETKHAQLDSTDGDRSILLIDPKPIPLSPCSQLEKDWNEGKTVRRSNLKKRRPFLKPKFSSAPSNTPCKTSESLATTVFRVSSASKIDVNYQQHNPKDLSCTILDPPKLRSKARVGNLMDSATTESSSVEQTAKTPEFETERKAIAGLKTPPLNIVTQKAPPMCYTPASEDDLFVDDYW